MTKTKSTKKALLMSVLSLLLCVSMLVGTTFAWFTDSVTSGSNVIKSGNLDLDVQYTLDGENWRDLNGATDLFQKGLWEPGHTEVVALKIANKGSLALKYVANMNIIDETVGKTKDGNDIVLSDILTVSTLVQQANDSMGVGDITLSLAFAGEENVAYENTTSFKAANILRTEKEMRPGDEYYMIVKVDMAETVGNEANHDGVNIPEINFGINFLATQYAYESDSFGKDYDANAAYGTYIELDAGDDLLAALASAEAGQPLTIKLLGNVEWPTPTTADASDITPASSVLIDGNGKTITATGNGVYAIGDNDAPITFKNLTVVDESVYRYEDGENAWEFTYLELGGNNTYENVKFTDGIMVQGGNNVFVDCEFVGHNNDSSDLGNVTMNGVWVYDGNATFTGCTFTGTRGMKICDMYAGGEVGTVVVDGCSFIGLTEKPGVAIDDEDAQDMQITIKNSTFINCQAGDQGLYVYETDNTVPTVENNTVLSNATLVSTKEELLALSEKKLTVNNQVVEEVAVVLTADIDLNNASFSSIIVNYGDKLTIVGNGHKISNVKIVSGDGDNTTGQAGMFYGYQGSELNISNLTLENITVTADKQSTGYAAAVVGYGECSINLNNVDVVNATVTGYKSSGVLVGHLSAGASLNATGCDVSGTVTLAEFAEESDGHYAGKYIGTLAGTATLTDCTANVTVSGNLKADNVGEVYGRNLGTLND